MKNWILIDNSTAYKNGAPVKLTKAQLTILNALLANRGEVSSFKDLYSVLWPDEERQRNTQVKGTLRTHISNLRASLGPDIIHCVHGLGYYIGPAREYNV